MTSTARRSPTSSARLDASELLVQDGTPAPAGGARRLRRSPRCRAAVFDLARAQERLRRVDRCRLARRSGRRRRPDRGPRRGCGARVLRASAHRDQPGPAAPRRCGRPRAAMRLDAHTRTNLELFTRLGGSGASLLQLLDATRTPMGVRLLRARLNEPLIDVDADHPTARLHRHDARATATSGAGFARPSAACATWSVCSHDACSGSRRRATSAPSATRSPRSTATGAVGWRASPAPT